MHGPSIYFNILVRLFYNTETSLTITENTENTELVFINNNLYYKYISVLWLNVLLTVFKISLYVKSNILPLVYSSIKHFNKTANLINYHKILKNLNILVMMSNCFKRILM